MVGIIGHLTDLVKNTMKEQCEKNREKHRKEAKVLPFKSTPDDHSGQYVSRCLHRGGEDNCIYDC